MEYMGYGSLTNFLSSSRLSSEISDSLKLDTIQSFASSSSSSDLAQNKTKKQGRKTVKQNVRFINSNNNTTSEDDDIREELLSEEYKLLDDKPSIFSNTTDIVKTGSVLSVVQQPVYKLSWAQKKEIIRDILSALAFLHCQDPPIMHRDIKTDNILIDRRKQAKLGDLGLVKTVSMDPNQTISGTLLCVPIGWRLKFCLLEYMMKNVIYFLLATTDIVSKELRPDIPPIDVLVEEILQEEYVCGFFNPTGTSNTLPEKLLAFKQQLREDISVVISVIRDGWQHIPVSRPSACNLLHRIEGICQMVV